MAIEQNAKLMPVVVFGEVSALQNPIDLPDLQKWTYKNLGFPIPYWVVGRWGVSPFPKREGLKFIIGEPISASAPHVPGSQVGLKVATLCSTRSHEAAVFLGIIVLKGDVTVRHAYMLAPGWQIACYCSLSTSFAFEVRVRRVLCLLLALLIQSRITKLPAMYD